MAKKKLMDTEKYLRIIIFLLLLIAIPLTLYTVQTFRSYIGFAKGNQQSATPTTGNGAPNGPHYNLNIIGVSKEKAADMTGTQGHTIFVPLTGKAKINLQEGETFEVIDRNATTGPALFQLPNPDPDNDGVTVYSVWARPLGKPGGKSITTTCALDEYAQEWCSTTSMVMVREKGKSTFTDVSKQLLYMYVDLNADGQMERYPLFDSTLQDYFWSYDNQGLKLVQLRFYQVMSDVN